MIEFRVKKIKDQGDNMEIRSKIYEVLKKNFGYSEFRKGQREIIEGILSGRDTLGIMPTGGGKSICYQIPAILFEGISLVISPLISLMEDQVGALNNAGISSVYINSSLSQEEMRAIYYGIEGGEYKLIYVAPERLTNRDFVESMRGMDISQIAVDEAHCISQWGHDFRKSYLSIPNFIGALKKRPVVSAFTATATPQVREDIVGNLRFDPEIFMNGFNRENLKFSVVKGVNSLTYIKKYLKEHVGESGIIYASTRKAVDAVYEELKERGYRTGRYHAGMKDIERLESQRAFVQDELDIMVATNAFGMGIDKSNVRFVIHNNLPRDMESYYQEAGRAGRDGLESECILIFNPRDILTQRFFIENNEFEAAEDVVDIKYEKLNSMVNYCHTSKCIRSYILEYFGDEGMEDCSNCSNCLDRGETEDITTEAQKIISCIGRTKERFGVTTIVGILAGSKNQNILRWNLDRETTYGIMGSYNQKEIRALVDLLIGDGYIEVIKGEFPTLKLTGKAYDFIRNKERLERRIERIEKKRVYEGEGFFERLKALRGDIAREEGKPPYTVFSDKTLYDMAKYLPEGREAFLEINGVGEVKYERYGERFLELMEGMRRENPKSQEEKEEKVSTGNKVKSHLLTKELYDMGKSVRDIAEERLLTENTVADHLIRCREEGIDVDMERLITPEKLCIVEATVKDVETVRLKEIKEKLQEDVDYYEIKLALEIIKNR